jgi:hypothetical protein
MTGRLPSAPNVDILIRRWLSDVATGSGTPQLVTMRDLSEGLLRMLRLQLETGRSEANRARNRRLCGRRCRRHREDGRASRCVVQPSDEGRATGRSGESYPGNSASHEKMQRLL